MKATEKPIAKNPRLDLPRPVTWNRPLVWFAAAMAILTPVTIVLAIVDPQQIMGENAWFKPMKFAVSFGIYSLTFAWLLGLVRKWQRSAQIAGTITAIALVIEIVIIVWAAAVGTTSHFNVATPLNAALWQTMSYAIFVLYAAALYVGILLSRRALGDLARNIAVRAGVVIGLVGMGVAFFMTSATPEQLRSFGGIKGAHAVGARDDGPGLPILGWSVEGGDFRAPHFIGLHAMQLLPLFALGLEWLSRRVPVLRDGIVRAWLVGAASFTYAAVVVITTRQALAGEPISRPSGETVVATIVAFAIAITISVAVLALRSSAARRPYFDETPVRDSV